MVCSTETSSCICTATLAQTPRPVTSQLTNLLSFVENQVISTITILRRASNLPSFGQAHAWQGSSSNSDVATVSGERGRNTNLRLDTQNCTIHRLATCNVWYCKIQRSHSWREPRQFPLRALVSNALKLMHRACIEDCLERFVDWTHLGLTALTKPRARDFATR